MVTLISYTITMIKFNHVDQFKMTEYAVIMYAVCGEYSASISHCNRHNENECFYYLIFFQYSHVLILLLHHVYVMHVFYGF